MRSMHWKELGYQNDSCHGPKKYRAFEKNNFFKRNSPGKWTFWTIKQAEIRDTGFIQYNLCNMISEVLTFSSCGDIIKHRELWIQALWQCFSSILSYLSWEVLAISSAVSSHLMQASFLLTWDFISWGPTQRAHH